MTVDTRPAHRPKLPKHIVYSATLNIRLTESEKEWISQAAVMDGQSMSQWARSRILDGFVHPDAIIVDDPHARL